MPYWVRVVFLNHLPRYLLMKRPDHDNRWQPKPFTPPPSYHTTPEAHRVNLNIRAPNDLLELTEMHHPHCKLNASSGSSANSGAVTKSVRDSPQTYSPGSAREGALPSTHAHTQAYRRHYGKMRENTESADSEFRMTPEVYKATEAIKFIYQHVKAEEEYSAVSAGRESERKVQTGDRDRDTDKNTNRREIETEIQTGDIDIEVGDNE